MKMTRWMKPVADCGGITSMIQAEVRKQWACAEQKDCRVDIVVHAYREVGTSLEAVVEVHMPKGPFGPFIKMGTLVV